MDGLVKRVNDIIEICWESFSAKIGCGLIEINKEASMQLNFAYLLKNTIDLAIHNEDEQISIELETSILVNGTTRECDVVIKISKKDELRYIPIELKCYKQFQSNGKSTDGYTQFRDNLHIDLHLLEQYSSMENYTNGISFVITNFANLVNRKAYWRKDISNGTVIQGGVVSNENYITQNPEFSELEYNYQFNWHSRNNWHFLTLKAID
jgi:hypothetical protein